MPVEANRIKGKLRELFPKVNLSTKRLDEISARLAKKATDEADDDAIAQLVNDANDYYSFAEIAKEDDKIRTLEANQKKPDSPDNDPQPPSDPKPPTPTNDDEPEWAKRLFAKVEAIEKGKVVENKTKAARDAFEKSTVFKNMTEKGKALYFKEIDIDSETPYEDQVKTIEEMHLEIIQSKADTTGFAGKPPVGANGVTASKEMIAAIVNKGR